MTQPSAPEPVNWTSVVSVIGAAVALVALVSLAIGFAAAGNWPAAAAMGAMGAALLVPGKLTERIGKSRRARGRL